MHTSHKYAQLYTLIKALPVKKVLCLLLVASFLVNNLNAQNNNSTLVNELIQENLALEKLIISTNKKLPNNAKQVKQLLLTELQDQIGKNSSFKLIHETESLLGRHYTFQQTYKGSPVFATNIKANIGFNGNLLSGYKNLVNTNLVTETKARDLTLNQQKINTYLSQNKYDRELEPENIWVAKNNELILNQKLLVNNKLDYYELIFNEYGELIYENNRSVYHHKHQCGNHNFLPDTTAQMWVFLPDPLTTAEREYGGVYIDNNDEDVEELNNQQQVRSIKTDFVNEQFVLQNEYVKIANNLAPNTPIYSSQVPVFQLNRSDTGFEDVNVYYHITKFQEYIQGLGVTNLTTQVLADPHSLNGADNSRFTAPSNGKIYLDFGEGNVDDAEDADVIIHEYTHALSHMANQSNISVERRAIDEALGDYFATSWSRSFSDYRWQDMFTWDGHNEFWNGRSMQTNKIYPDDVSNDIYPSSEVFSSALMDIYNELGRTETDILVLQLLYFLTGNSGMEDAADDLLVIDENLNNGKNQSAISRNLFERNLTKQIYFNAGKDTTICLGTRLALGEPEWNIDDLNFSWTSTNVDEEVAYPNFAEIWVEPLKSASYTVAIEDEKNNVDYTQTVNVIIDDCVILEGLSGLVNTQSFTSGISDLIVQFDVTVTEATVLVYDIKGKLVRQISHASNEPLSLNIQNIATGIYGIKVIANNTKQVFKVVKAK